MPELSLRKIPFTVDAENRLRTIKARTGLDRNFLCRLGFCLSLEEPGIPTLPNDTVKGGREIDRYTLLGQHDQAYIALLLLWMKEKNVAFNRASEVDNNFVAHMNRGVEIVASRVKSLSDMSDLLPKPIKTVITEAGRAQRIEAVE